MNVENRNYWGYRIDESRSKFFMDELYNERLRQGWGYDERQNLKDFKMDRGAGRNKPMLKKVKKGDILLIPNLPSYGYVTIAEAIDDWNEKYEFKIDSTYNDYGHIFPAKFIIKFSRYNQYVTGNIRSTLKCSSRFWNINHYKEDIEKLLNLPKEDLVPRQDHRSRMLSLVGDAFNDAFDNTEFNKSIYSKFNEQFTAAEWEFALEIGLKKLFPFYHVERIGGKNEKNHGSDILIKLPTPLQDYEYAIAIQVKDYSGVVDRAVINQVNKADSYWNDKYPTVRLIDKWVIITKANEDNNKELIEYAKSVNVKIIFAEELKELLNKIALTMVELN